MSNIVGDSVRIEQETLLDDVLTEPASATLTITAPDGITLVREWPATPEELVHPSLGLFRYDLLLDQDGLYRWRFECSGSVSNVVENVIEVLPLTVDITIHAYVAGPVDVPNAIVSVFQDEAIVNGGVSDSDGNVMCALQPGSYKIEVRKDRFVFADTDVTVTADGTVNVLGIELAISRGASPATTRVYGFVNTQSGRGLSGVRVTVDFFSGGKLVSGTGSGVTPLNQGVASSHLEVTTQADGYWEVDLVAGTIVQVRIPVMNFQRTFRVPAESPLNIADAREDPGTGRNVGVRSSVHDKEG